jgi:hypothetical protein
LKSGLWVAFFGAILLAWWVMYSIATQMGLNWYGAQVGAMDMVVMASMDSMGDFGGKSAEICPIEWSGCKP